MHVRTNIHSIVRGTRIGARAHRIHHSQRHHTHTPSHTTDTHTHTRIFRIKSFAFSVISFQSSKSKWYFPSLIISNKRVCGKHTVTVQPEHAYQRVREKQ